MPENVALVERSLEEYTGQFAGWVVTAEPGTPAHDELARDYTRAVLIVASEAGLPSTGDNLNDLFNRGMTSAAEVHQTERGLVAAEFTTAQWRHLRRRLFGVDVQLPPDYRSAEWSGARYLGWLAERAVGQFNLTTR